MRIRLRHILAIALVVFAVTAVAAPAFAQEAKPNYSSEAAKQLSLIHI